VLDGAEYPSLPACRATPSWPAAVAAATARVICVEEKISPVPRGDSHQGSIIGRVLIPLLHRGRPKAQEPPSTSQHPQEPAAPVHLRRIAGTAARVVRLALQTQRVNQAGGPVQDVRV